jgi:NAD(P)-dependent dehydrogenase (short-subunit alcohol dehydrogenase family)
MGSVEAKQLSGKVALVTGGSRGIGKAVAAAFASEGARAFICARNGESVARAVADIRNQGGDADGTTGDVGNPEDVDRIARGAIARYGAIDVLVNNASLLGPRLPVADYPLTAWEDVLRVNVTGVFLMTQRVLRLMIPRRSGSIINVSSGVGRIGRPRWGAYAVSKFGVEGLTQMLAEEVKDLGIRVNAVNPGPTRTEMRAEAYPEEDPLTLPTPEKIVPVFVYLASDASREVTGKSFEAQDWSPPAV